MDHAAELEVCQRRDQALEVGWAVGIDSEFVIGRSVIDLAREDQSTALSFGLQELAQPSAGTMTIGEDEPVPGSLFGPGFGSLGDDDGLFGENSVGRGEGDGMFKSMVEEQTLPAGGRNQGMGRTQVEIGESPPTVGQAEDQIDEAHRSGTLQQEEQG